MTYLGSFERELGAFRLDVWTVAGPSFLLLATLLLLLLCLLLLVPALLELLFAYRRPVVYTHAFA